MHGGSAFVIPKEFYADGVAMVASRRLSAGTENGTTVEALVGKAGASCKLVKGHFA